VNNLSLDVLSAVRQASRAAQMASLATIGLTVQEVEIFQRIQGAILEQRLPPATRLTEEELAEIFAVSRMRVRRVLLALAHTGMIALARGRGAQVASPTAEEARAVFGARQLIETALLEQASPPPPAATARLKRMIAAEETAQQTGDRAAAIHLSGGFHIELAQICANPVVAEIVAGLVTRSSLVIALFQRSGNVCCRSDDHLQLVEALAKPDLQAAVNIMRRHLTSIESGLDLTAKRPDLPNLHEILSSP
jgi:DNA-binding GntR family transcriptional regulator